MKARECNFKNAWTLIELLVVISIISVLAGLLLPALKEARDKAKQGVCISNLKQIGQASMMYLQDNNDWFPNGDSANWIDSFWPYTSEKTLEYQKGIFRCPSVSQYVLDIWARNGGYGYNIYAGSGSYGYATRLYQVTNPSQFSVVGDGPDEPGSPSFNYGYIFSGVTGLSDPKLIGDRHNGGINIVFADGHVGWLLKETILATGTKYYTP